MWFTSKIVSVRKGVHLKLSPGNSYVQPQGWVELTAEHFAQRHDNVAVSDGHKGPHGVVWVASLFTSLNGHTAV